MKPWSEERLHRWLRGRPRRRGSAQVGSPGHDAAVLRAEGARTVLAVDQTIEGVHFAPRTRPADVGKKAVGRALSDLAATAARPIAVLLTVRAPRRTSEAWMRAVIAAVDARARELGAELVGGDLAEARGGRALAVTAVGLLDGRVRPPGRDRARPGDVVLVTGPLGGSELGRHLWIEPRLEAGRALFAAGAHALIDVSDGFARDADRLARASAVRIDLTDVPVHPDALRLARGDEPTARAHALFDGEDHELVATMPRTKWERAGGRLRRAVPDLAVVGRVRRGTGLWLSSEAGGPLARWDGKGGWTHGAS